MGAEYYKQGARFAKWRSVVNIAAGPSDKALFDCAYGLARYAAICQENGLVPIVEPEILLDGEHDIDTTLEIASKTWAQVFKCLADQDVMFEGVLLKLHGDPRRGLGHQAGPRGHRRLHPEDAQPPRAPRRP